MGMEDELACWTLSLQSIERYRRLTAKVFSKNKGGWAVSDFKLTNLRVVMGWDFSSPDGIKSWPFCPTLMVPCSLASPWVVFLKCGEILDGIYSKVWKTPFHSASVVSPNQFFICSVKDNRENDSTVQAYTPYTVFILVQDILCSAQHAYQPLQQPSTVLWRKF